MKNLKSFLMDTKAITLLLCIVAVCDNCLSGFAQTTSSNNTSDKYLLSAEPTVYKPELQYFQVRLKDDHGVSLIDLDGNIIVRNFTPISNSYGRVVETNYTSPVINDVFSVARYKKGSDWMDSRRSITIYQNASSPTPIPGLTDLYSANVINPNLFPISRYGERIKFVDKYGREKFTVMPIDGKEPKSVSPVTGGNRLILVKVENDEYGAINTKGEWVIYPEWNRIMSYSRDTILGLKDKGEIYKITLTDKLSHTKLSHTTRIDTPIDFYFFRNGKYLPERFVDDNGEQTINIYDYDYKYITTLNNTDYVQFSWNHPDLLLVRRNFVSGSNDFYCLIDISKNNAVVSKHYSYMEELPDGNYLAYNQTSQSDVHKCWYVKADGTGIELPNNTSFPLRHPSMALGYLGTVNRFIVKPTDENTGYICDSNGEKVGNLEIVEYYNQDWEGEPVQSSYYRINIVDKKNK